MKCSNCGTENQDSYKFCMTCGNPLTPPVQPAQSENWAATTVIEEPEQQAEPRSAMPQPIPPASPQSLTPQGPSYQQPSPPPMPVQKTWIDSVLNDPNRFPPPGSESPSIFSIWGPFAGYGTRRRHIGWLMEGQGDRASELKGNVKTHLDHRETPGFLEEQVLSTQGLVNRRRSYYLKKKNLVTLGLFITDFGRDLFVSMVSYLKPPISWVKVIILVLMVIFQFYMMFAFANSVGNAFASGGNIIFGGGPDFGSLAFLLFVVGPLGTLNTILLGIFFIYSIYKFLKEKDILGGLRASTNEFDEDDLMAMEKAVDEVVRQSLTELKLNPDDLKLTFSEVGRQLF